MLHIYCPSIKKKYHIYLAIIVFAFAVLGGCQKSSSGGELTIDEINKINNDVIILFGEGKYNEALEKLKSVDDLNTDNLSPEVKDGVANALCKKGYLQLFIFEDYMDSFKDLTKAKEIAESLPESVQLSSIYINLAALYKVYADTRSSTYYLNLAFDEALYHKNYKVLLTSAFNILNEGFWSSLPPDTKQRLNRLKRISIPENPMKDVVISMLNAYTLSEENQIDEAILELNNIKKDSIENSTVGRLSDLCNILTLSMALKSQDIQKSVKYATRLEDSLDSLDSDNKAAALFHIAAAYHAAGNNDKGYNYYNEAFRLRDSIFSVGKYSLLHDWELKNKEKRHAATIENTLAEKQRLWKIILGVLAILIVLGATVTFIALQNKKLKNRNQHLIKKYEDNNLMEEELLELRKERDELRMHLMDLTDNNPLDTMENMEILQDESDSSENNGDEIEESKNSVRELIMLRTLTSKVIEILNSDEVTYSDFSLDKLAKLTCSNRAYVSKVINNLYKKNFKTVLNEIRIRIACQRLREPGIYRNMTVEALSESVGYKSRSNFVVTFKKITGLSPSDYRKADE